MKTPDWSDDWPDWQDAGKRVVIAQQDGQIVEATLSVKDQFFTGEEEIPIFAATQDDGKPVDFAGATHWRFA